MDIVHLLPDNVANQIAAGEVIQRPASCLKELVENSLDAGATRIDIIIRDAGRTLLQVIDNGSGMSETDARMAMERHATSKIHEAADLFRLTTNGFRGEALASICAVAQIEVLTRRAEDEVGTVLEISGSEVTRQEPASCPVGTNFKVKNLFFNVPVRRKFLKTDQTEMRNILQEFYRIVLVYPKVQFTLISQDEIIWELPAGTEKQRIEQLFGHGNKSFTGQLVDIKVDTEIISIRGFVGKPESANRQPQQYFFVNGRYMRHPYFHKAVMNAYSGMLTGDATPSYFIYFALNPSAIDVNIHPTKTEIKFQDEQLIFPILLAAVREALGKFNVAPSLDFDTEGRIEMPVHTSATDTKLHIPVISNGTDYNPFHTRNTDYRPSVNSYPASVSSRSLPEPPADSIAPLSAATDTVNPAPSMAEPPAPTLFDPGQATGEPLQYAQRYIMLPATGGLMLIDQHRAHACVLYSIYMQQISMRQGTRQQLLFPDIWEVNRDDAQHVLQLIEDLSYVGFELEQISPNAFSISAVPSLLSGKDATGALKQILEQTQDSESIRQQWQQRIAWSLAKASAITAKTMTQHEMQNLLDQLWKLPSYHYTPDGQTVVTMLTDEEIIRRFR
ncbi:MAG: DNA mismatch repair endonuclease MutL [Paludibacteraceae bacterium]|nr:DNA mismatch repair endonuclease MutL [Paludibacteraceae bacterium]